MPASGTLQKLKYEYRRDITDRASLEANFREKFEDLSRVRLTDAEFARLLDEIITPDVFSRRDGSPASGGRLITAHADFHSASSKTKPHGSSGHCRPRWVR